MRRIPAVAVLVLAALTATVAHAQSTVPAEGPKAPIAEAMGKVPAIGVRVGVGTALASIDNPEPGFSAGVMIRLHRYFSLDVEAGHYTARSVTEFPGYTKTKTERTTFGSASVVWRVDLRRASVWAGAGLIGGPTQEEFFYSGDGSHHRIDSTLVAMRLTGGADVPIGSRFGVFGSIGNVGSTTLLQGGVRIALQSAPSLVRSPTSPVAAPPHAPALRVKRGDLLWVIAKSGDEHHGELLALSAEAVDLLVGGQTISVPFPQVRLIEKPDSLWNGARWGAVTGGASMAVMLLFAGYFGGADESSDVPAAIGISAAGAGAGMLLGAGLDALAGGRQSVYRAPGDRTLSVSPKVVPRGIGACMRLVW